MVARVVFTSDFSRRYTGGVHEFTVEAKNLRGIIKEMDRLYPGLGEHLEEETTGAILETEEAFGFCEDPPGQPQCQVVEPGERHWRIFRDLSVETETSGSRVSDAWLAALAIEWECEWVTLDRD